MSADLVTTTGRPLRLGAPLGKGGEGEIYRVESKRPLALKLYNQGKAADREEKVLGLIEDRMFKQAPFVAFPIEAVYSGKTFVGFTMRQAVGAKPLHLLCTPGDRKTEFPEADYQFLVRVARNFVRAIAKLHQLGVVVGDVNESLALIDQKGQVAFVDSDSFQYRRGRNIYRCKVGKPEYTPPELQGQSLEKADRTVEHDAFGLAVIIFELLFLGRHPFAGSYRGAGEQLTIAKAIQEGRFAYSPQASLTQMAPPPHAPLLADMPSEVANAFQRAFGSPKGRSPVRPTAAEWAPILERMDKGLVACTANRAHRFPRNAARCPWCRLESGLGVRLFGDPPATGRGWFGRIPGLADRERVRSPRPALDLAPPPPAAAKGKPAAARNFRTWLWGRKRAGIATGGRARSLMRIGMAWGLVLSIPAAVLVFDAVSGRGPSHGAPRGLEIKKVEMQKQKGLAEHEIGRAGGERTGAESPLAMESAKIVAAPGFGPELGTKLRDWRKRVGASLKLDPDLPIDPSRIAKFRDEFLIKRSAAGPSPRRPAGAAR